MKLKIGYAAADDKIEDHNDDTLSSVEEVVTSSTPHYTQFAKMITNRDALIVKKIVMTQ